MILWRWWTAYLCILSIDIPAVVSEKNCRTRFLCIRPTTDNVSSILVGNINDDVSTKVSYNHEEVGITRPSIRDDYDDIFPSCIGYLKKKRRKGEQIIKENNNNDITTICSNKTVDGWRLLRFYKRVGCGKSCYRRVQEAVFNWDFTSHVGKKSKGIISAATECKRSINKTRKNLLATFTEIYIPRPLKSVFVVNPVHVVYDVKNHQKSTTKGRCISSCSAYATLSGHLLSGEERVSVVVWNRGKDEVYVEILSFSRASPSTVGRLIWPLIGGMQKNFFLEELDHLDKVANEI